MNSIAVFVFLGVLNGLYFSTTSNHQQKKPAGGHCKGFCFSGKNGRDGRDGQPGNPGNSGPPGRDGTKGSMGIQGIKGERGLPGTQGIKGSRGIKGEQGKQGQGEKGDKGLDGVCAKNCQSAVKKLERKIDEMNKKVKKSYAFIKCIMYQHQPALGMNSYAIKDAQLIASSVYVDKLSVYGPQRARLNKAMRGWAAKDNNVNQWLQVKFAKKTFVFGVATQGSGRFKEWVKTYQIAFSNDGSVWKPYKEDAQTKNFTGNTDKSTVVKHNLRQYVLTLFMRILPQTWHNHISMRMEVYGCYFY